MISLLLLFIVSPELLCLVGLFMLFFVVSDTTFEPRALVSATPGLSLQLREMEGNEVAAISLAICKDLGWIHMAGDPENPERAKAVSDAIEFVVLWLTQISDKDTTADHIRSVLETLDNDPSLKVWDYMTPNLLGFEKLSWLVTGLLATPVSVFISDLAWPMTVGECEEGDMSPLLDLIVPPEPFQTDGDVSSYFPLVTLTVITAFAELLSADPKYNRHFLEDPTVCLLSFIAKCVLCEAFEMEEGHPDKDAVESAIKQFLSKGGMSDV